MQWSDLALAQGFKLVGTGQRSSVKTASDDGKQTIADYFPSNEVKKIKNNFFMLFMFG